MDKADKIPMSSPLVSDELKKQMIPLFSKMTKNVNLKAILDYDDEKSIELGSFLKVIASCSDKIEIDFIEKDENMEIQEQLNGEHLPVVGIYGETYSGACFHGVPGGKEINSFIAAICYKGGAANPLDKRVTKNIALIKKDISIKIFVSLACHHCPHVVAACQKIAMENPYVTADMYDAKLYLDIIETYKVERVPMMVINESQKVMGQKTIEEIVNRLMNI